MNVSEIPNVINIKVEEVGQRLDVYVTAALPELSRTEAQRLIKEAMVTVNGERAKSSYRVEAGDAISVTVPAPKSTVIEPEAIPLDVIYEDDDLAVVNKPAGMVVHPAVGSETGTLVHAALSRWPEMRRVTGEERAGIVHRLDKDTSGVIVLAKTTGALKSLQEQFKARTVAKKYLALAEGQPKNPVGLIDAPIARDRRQRKRMAVVKGGREAQTGYTVIEEFEACSLLECTPATGRTHQIRVHLGFMGNPIVGDGVYGRRRQATQSPRLFLHAFELQIDSPTSGERLTFSAPLPDDLQQVLDGLRRTNG